MKKISHALIIGIGFLMPLASLCHAQDTIRTVVDPGKNKYQNQPIELMGCEIGDGTVSNCAQLLGGRDWWKTLTLTLKNVSAKTISEFNLELAIEKHGPMTANTPIVLVPQPPFERVVDVDGHPSYDFRRRVQPGETFKMMVPKAEYQQMDAWELDHLLFVIQFIFFDDGTRWDFGRESRIRSGQSSDITQKRINE